MKNKICFKCKIEQTIDNFYVHKEMSDGYLNKCKDCTKQDTNKKTILRICKNCNISFMANANEVKRRGGGAKTCSRICYYAYQPKMLEEKWNGKRGYDGIHAWVERKLGKPSLCSFCKCTDGKFEWSNISGKYLENLNDWQRLCIPCHRRYDETGKKAWITRRKNKQYATYTT